VRLILFKVLYNYNLLIEIYLEDELFKRGVLSVKIIMK